MTTKPVVTIVTDEQSTRTDGPTRESRADRGRTDGGVAETAVSATDGPDAGAGVAGCPIADPPHPAADLLSLLGKAHAMRVLATLAHEEPRAWRFGELEDELDVSPNTLSARLSEFQEADLVTRTAYNEIPPRVEYEATDRARELDPVFRELHDWMHRHGDPSATDSASKPE